VELREFKDSMVIPAVLIQKTEDKIETTQTDMLRDWKRYKCLDFAALKSCVAQTVARYVDNLDRKPGWGIGWYSVVWGNQVVLIENDDSLWIATKELEVKGKDEIEFRVRFDHNKKRMKC